MYNLVVLDRAGVVRVANSCIHHIPVPVLEVLHQAYLGCIFDLLPVSSVLERSWS